MTEAIDLKQQVDDFLNQTEQARLNSQRNRDYYDGKQWTDDQIKKLHARNQAPIVTNRIKPKVKGIKGLAAMRNTDPKAYPRTQKHEQGAYAVTDALRYVTDNNDFDETKQLVLEEFLIEGYSGVVVDVSEDTNGEVQIDIEHYPYDRVYFDPHSRKKDFSDSTFMGKVTWMDVDEAAKLFNVEEGVFSASTDNGDDTLDDRPRWYTSDNGQERVMIAKHFFLKDGVWHIAFFSGDTMLVDPEHSPYLDEFGEPSNPIELISLYVDRDNNRYGEVNDWVDTQDEMNHRRSKALHLLSNRQTTSRNGAIKNIPKMKNELSKPNGHVDYEGEAGDFDILGTNDMASGQFDLYLDSKQELDAISFNAQLAGERQGDLSGVAIDKLQTAGTLELNDIFNLMNGWEKRVYRKIWERIKQFWDGEKWIRVTDDRKNMRFVGLNHKVTAQEALEERINDESLELEDRQSAMITLQLLTKDTPERLQEIIEVRNDTNDLDVDIILDQSFDSVNVQQEQFKMLAPFVSTGEVDIVDLLELSELREKDKIIEQIEQRRAAAAQAGNNAVEIQAMSEQAKAQETLASAELKKQQALDQQIKNMKTLNGTEDSINLQKLIADTNKTQQEALQKGIENQILVTQPVDTDPQVVI